jgi:hypothetical protein
MNNSRNIKSSKFQLTKSHNIIFLNIRNKIKSSLNIKIVLKLHLMHELNYDNDFIINIPN